MVDKLRRTAPRRIKEVSADGAYDGFAIRRLLHEKDHERDIEAFISPPSHAQVRESEALSSRNEFLKIWKGLGGDEIAKGLRKKLLGYIRRSLVETAFSRLKGIFGERFSSRFLPHIAVEAHMKCWILNKWAA